MDLLEQEVLATLFGDWDVLIAQAPPRHGKSEFLSRRVPSWYHSVFPANRTILTSCSLGLARAHSRWVRNEVNRLSGYFQNGGVNPYVSAQAEWETAYGGGIKAAGVDGDIIGRGANLFIVDDFIRNSKQATSLKVRESQWEWFQTTARSRIEPGGKLIVLATRWHEEDLIGKILKYACGEAGWRVREIRLPALAEPTEAQPDLLGRKTDEALWPERWSSEYLMRLRDGSDPYWWAALYQQRLGSYGKNEWPAEYFYNVFAQDDEWPESFLVSATALDPSKGRNTKSGDYSAIVTVGFSKGYLWVDADLQRRPVPQIMRDLVEWNTLRRPMVTGIEGVLFQELLGPDYEQAQIELGNYRDVPVMIDNSISKTLRISRLGQWLRLHRVKIRNTPGGRLLLQQLKDFPNGDHDDGPDAMEMAVRLLESLSEALAAVRGPDILQP